MVVSLSMITPQLTEKQFLDSHQPFSIGDQNKCAEVFPKMFNDKKVIKKIKTSGSPVRVMTRDQVIKMFQDREVYLKGLLKELRKK
jgi:hypothetical protein